MTTSTRRIRPLIPWTAVLGLVVSAVALNGCGGSKPTEPTKLENLPTPPGSLELVFTFGSEKDLWIREVTQAFNDAKNVVGGKPVFVQAIPLGSGESIDEILEGRRQVHLTSPASAAFIDLGNAVSRAKTGKDLLGKPENLVLSPVVIAMWEPMAEELGWPGKRLGWADVLNLAKAPDGWGSRGHPAWGKFKFGHTHPEYSNSGLISLFAEVYAGTGKVKGLTLDDVRQPKVAEYLSGIEKSVVHYGSSTGFFGDRMFDGGISYLSAAVLYENMVVKANHNPDQANRIPIVAIYPKEGTFWSDHPAAVVQREWVTPAHQEAATLYLKYLLDRPQQEKAMAYGFRPADVQIPLAAPLDKEHKVDPSEPKTTLEVPRVEVMEAIKQLWRENKKHSHIVLVFDKSGSMMEDHKMENAKAGAAELVKMLGDEDKLSLLPFNNLPLWDKTGALMKSDRNSVAASIKMLQADGGTALYDAISQAYRKLQEKPDPDRIDAIVVLTDGADTDSRLKLDPLLELIRPSPERPSLRVFTIGYGRDAQKDVLKKIAETTRAKFYEGKPENIRQVFKEIATFF